MRTVSLITAAGIVLFAIQPVFAAQTFDGLWASSKRDCRDREGPDSKTMIDLDNVIKGKPAPLVDSYENHCRVDRKTPAGDGLTLSTTCFEFWDDYKKNANGRKLTIKLAPGAGGTIKIDGKPYLLCKRKDQLPKSR